MDTASSLVLTAPPAGGMSRWISCTCNKFRSIIQFYCNRRNLFREHLGSAPVYRWGQCCSSYSFLCFLSFFFVMYLMLHVSLYYLFLIAPSVFSNIYCLQNIPPLYNTVYSNTQLLIIPDCSFISFKYHILCNMVS